MSQITLYTKSDCHLCDLAHQMLSELGLRTSIINIQSNAELIKKYRLIIPVIVFEDMIELNWPFDAITIQSRLDQR
ncbi:MAG: glutaredoxin [Methylophagaceae bacterium]|jgi:glutaredoxin